VRFCVRLKLFQLLGRLFLQRANAATPQLGNPKDVQFGTRLLGGFRRPRCAIEVVMEKRATV
jgi:hypothetical protein